MLIPLGATGTQQVCLRSSLPWYPFSCAAPMAYRSSPALNTRSLAVKPPGNFPIPIFSFLASIPWEQKNYQKFCFLLLASFCFLFFSPFCLWPPFPEGQGLISRTGRAIERTRELRHNCNETSRNQLFPHLLIRPNKCQLRDRWDLGELTSHLKYQAQNRSSGVLSRGHQSRKSSW